MLVAAVLLLSGCSSSKSTSTPSPTATIASTPAARASAVATVAGASPAARPPASASAAAAASAAAPQVTATLSPLGTQSPEQAALTQKLTPLLIQTADLPAGEKAMQPVGVVPVSNADYARNRSDAAAVQARLGKDGRLGGVQAAWSISGQYFPGEKIVNALQNLLSEYQSDDGAKDGLAVIFSQLQTAQPSTAALQTKVSPIDTGTVGDESQAYRVEQELRTLAGTPTPSLTTITQIFYAVGWRRGKSVSFITLNAVNEDPSLDDLKQLAQTQDKRLQAAGY